MATVGDQLTSPEPGWKRYDDRHPAIQLIGGWVLGSDPSGSYNSTITGINDNITNGTIKFKFQGTKIRIIGYHASNRSRNIEIKIDGVSETFSQYSASFIKQALSYEKAGLSNGIHTVEIIKNEPTTNGSVFLDAIDIDDAGRLLHPDEVTDIKDLDIGKRIRCHYQASSGQVGVFSGLGQETSDFIPAASSATPNGDFYFIHVDDDHLGRKILVADRNVQHSISWDTLNTNGIASGSGVPVTIAGVPLNVNLTLRLLTGGVDSSDKDNEWDKYIVSSDLNGTITPGDDSVWNWSGGGQSRKSWTSTTYISSSSNRVVRGNMASSGGVSAFTQYSSSKSALDLCFRPVLLIEVIVYLPTFEGSVDRASIHNENVILTGTISHPNNKNVKYRILVNGVQEYPQTDYTPLAPPPIFINYIISNSKFRLGGNQITVEMVDSEGVVGTWTTTVTLNSQAPTITATMTGMRLDANIGDPESDLVRFRVELNGGQIYPVDTSQQFTEYLTPAATYQRLFRSDEVIIGENNTINIIAQDKFGSESIVTLNFVGEYTGLMFADEQGSYYSTDLGEILKYLDVGTLIAGQTSLEFKINLINKLPFSVKNIYLWSEHNIDMDVEFSKTNNPFIPEQSLTYDQVLNYNEVISFYVRLKTNTSAQYGGNFDIKVSAEKV